MRRLASVPAFFGLRVASALLLLKLSASFLPVAGFAVFSQLMLLAALINMVAVGGAQNGLIRQAAAAADEAALGRVQGAAFAIWATVAPLLLIAVIAGSAHLSRLLVGVGGYWPVVIGIALIGLAGGPGQIWCGLLSGRQRVPHSLGAQATGLVAGTAAAGFLIARGDPAAATLAFASGSLVTTGIAYLLARPLRAPLAWPRSATADLRALLEYSAAFAATSGYTSVVLFGLRSVYRAAFGATALGYWVAANRISDMSTQLLGLFMIQFVVPHLAAARDEAARRGLLLRCWAAGSATMALGPLVFAVAARPLVHLFLSDAFLPATPAIRTYMIGDVLRVTASLAMYAAFARGRPARYAGIEMGTLTLMAAVTLALVSAGRPHAPQIGYVAAYGIVALLVGAAFLWPRLERRAAAYG
jgi:O-antigen/teichoic acid export membrane protein